MWNRAVGHAGSSRVSRTPRARVLVGAAVLAAVAVGPVVIAASASAAVNLHVATYGTDAGACQTASGAPVSSAVSVASAGKSILVGRGTFVAPVTMPAAKSPLT